MSTRLQAGQKVLAVLVHIYTAIGALLALLMANAVTVGDYRRAFLCLWLASWIDLSDGALARRFRVSEILPTIDGAKIDLAVDFLTNIFVPLYLVLRIDALPHPALLWASIVLIASLYRFANYNPILEQGFMWGLPPVWSIFSYYIFYLKPGPFWICLIVLAYSFLSFFPFGYIHVARFRQWRKANVMALAAWWLIFLLVTQGIVSNPTPWLAISLLFVIYYGVVSCHFYLSLRREEPASTA